MNPLLPNLLDNEVAQKDQSTAVFGTFEWASHNANFISGCRHDCKYCYSKSMAIRFQRKTANSWKIEEIRTKSLKRKFRKMEGTIMFPSSHDINPIHLDQSIEFLESILNAGNNVLIVTKPHLECIREICRTFQPFKSNILFRFTIGSSDSEVLRFWEPGAPDFVERYESLQFAFESGFKTSVSCEPMLDNDINSVIEKVVPFVTDAIWLGKANSLPRRLGVNCGHNPELIIRANQLLAGQSDDYILSLYYQYQGNPKIKWKESLKRIIGMPVPTEKGLDV